MRRIFASLAAVLMVFGLMAAPASAEQFRIAIMQDELGDAAKYQPLLDYLKARGVDAGFVTARNYPAAAEMFAGGRVDAMFSGSGIAGTMIIKDLAEPVVRPIAKDGTSTYWAVVLARKGAPSFTGSASYFKDKQVIYCALASSGEFYFHSIPGAAKSGAKTLIAASHGSAIDALSRGKADIAIVKNRVWDSTRADHPNVVKVGEDKGQNPNGTLIAARSAPAATVAKVKAALLAIADDSSPKAIEVRKSLGIIGYTETTEKDFSHTLGLLKEAGVTKAFNFSY